MEEVAEIPVTQSSGNVFAGLGFENPEEELAKADLVIEIARTMKVKKLTERKVATLIGIDAPALSRLLRGHTGSYSIDRLIHILNLLGQDVEIRVRPSSEPTAHLSVAVMPTP